MFKIAIVTRKNGRLSGRFDFLSIRSDDSPDLVAHTVIARRSALAAAVNRGFRAWGERYHDRHRVQESTA